MMMFSHHDSYTFKPTDIQIIHFPVHQILNSLETRFISSAILQDKDGRKSMVSSILQRRNDFLQKRYARIADNNLIK